MAIRAISNRFFNWLHGHQLVYNTCWEDPKCDRVALELGPEDTLVVITSAGCNILDYALEGPKALHAVDVNFRQNALLELKLAGIQTLDFETFFALFGKGRLTSWKEVYPTSLRDQLSPTARTFWDKYGKFFDGSKRRSFYFRGSSGTFARVFNFYLDRVAKGRAAVDAMLATDDLEEQKRIYFETLKPRVWRKLLRWFMRRDAVMAMLGVPREQRLQIDRVYDEGGVAQFVENQLDALFTRTLLSENYFWRVYLTGEYTRECCPEYLKEANFERLGGGLASRIHVHTKTLLEFLRDDDFPISRFVLLDHMDWLSGADRAVLCEQWQAIVDRSAPDSRVLWRSASPEVDFVDPIKVRIGEKETTLKEVLHYRVDMAQELHAKDRVNTYGSFYVADLSRSRIS